MSEYEELALKLRSWAHVCRNEGARHALSPNTLDEIADAILVLSAALTLCNHLRRIGTGMCTTCNYPDPSGLYEMEGTEARCINCVNAIGDHDPQEVADALELAHRLKRMPVEWFISRLDMVHELLDARQTQHGLWYVDKGKVVTQTEYYDTALEALRAAQGDL